MIKKVLRLIKEIRLDDSLDQIQKCDVLLFCHDVDRSISLDGQAYSPLIDSVREDFEKRGYKCISISHPWSKLTGKKGFCSPISFNRSYLVAKFGDLLKRFGFPFIYFDSNSLFRNILLASKPKVIITIGCSDELCFQARLLNILHLELLHGIGYTSIPWGWDKKEIQFLPQGILVLDQKSIEAFSPLADSGIDLKLIPHPFLKRFMPSKLRNLPKEWIPNENNYRKWKKEILVSLQWAYAGDHGDYIEFANILKNGLFFEEIERLIAENKEIFWRFRFHPVQLRQKKYKYLLEYMDEFVSRYPNSEWKESSTLPFPIIAMSCEGNITMSSMSCYDAAACGVTSLMLCPTLLPGAINQDWYLDLENEGYVLKSSPEYESIKSWILSAKKINPRLSNLNKEKDWESFLESLNTGISN